MSSKFGEYKIRMHAQEFEFRATLRAAFLLERKYDGFESLFTDIIAGKFTAIWNVLHVTAKDDATRDRLRAMRSKPLNIWQSTELNWLLLGVVLALAGVDPDRDEAPIATPEVKITYREHFEDLYRKATGWLGWSPEQAWNATPFEIVEAMKGRGEFLRATHGVSEDNDNRPGDDADVLDRAGLDELRSMSRI